MTERDSRLKKCISCDEFSGTMYGFGKCAPCANSKGFDLVCACDIPGCAACKDYADTPEEEKAEHTKYIKELHAELRASGVIIP